jgi:two-component system, NtrC family, nitrogen regulation sensor histidine kinase NtrY
MSTTSFLEKLEKPFLSLVKIGLRTKIILALVLTLVITLGTVSYLALGIVVKQFNKMSQDRIQNLQHALSRQLDIRKDDAVQKLVQTSKLIDLKRKILVRYEGQIDYAGLAILLADFKESTGLDLLEVCDKQGIVLGSGHEPGRAGENRMSDPLVKVALYGQVTTDIEEENLLTGNFLAIKVAVPVEQRGEIVGALTGGYLINSSFLERFKELSDVHVLLLRSHEPPITTFMKLSNAPEPSLQIDSTFVKHALISKQPLIEDLRISNVSYRVGTSPIISNNKIIGALVVAVANEDITKTVSDLQRTFVSYTLVAIVLSVLVAYFLAIRITRPVEALVDGAVAIASGDFKQEIPITTKDEIAMLIGAFNYMAKELKENQEKLIAAIRLAEWQEVARRLAHEIKNPLTPIALSIQNLQRSYENKDQDLDETFKESTQTILEEVDHLRKIVNEFSSFARMPKPQKEWIQIVDILDSTISLYENLQKNVRIIKEYSRSIPFIYADPEQLRHVFSNLIKNAIDAMSQGGILTIRIQTESDSDKLFLSVEFADTGDGMTEETQKKLFIPYYSTKEKGTGLGLSIVERIVSEHGGTIKVESELGKGSRLILRFPVETKITESENREINN